MTPREEFDRYIPAHIQDNYRQVVMEQHGGDYGPLADQFARDGEDRLSRWARHEGELADAAKSRQSEVEGTTTVRGRRAPARETA